MPIDLTQLAGPNPDPELSNEALREIPVDEEFAEYVYLLGVDLLNEGGMDTLRKIINQSGDPMVVIAQFIVQMVAQLSEVLSQETNFDPRVMLAPNGFVDSITDYIVEKLGMEEEASDMIEQEVLEMIKGLAQGETQPDPNAGAPMEQAAGGMPQEQSQMGGGQPAIGLDQMAGGF